MTDTFHLEFTVTGRGRVADIVASHTLLDVLRDDIGLTGTKECCVVGECGACTVIVDGKPINSCLMLAAEADGADVLTVEGLAQEGRLGAPPAAFLARGCGA